MTAAAHGAAMCRRCCGTSGGVMNADLCACPLPRAHGQRQNAPPSQSALCGVCLGQKWLCRTLPLRQHDGSSAASGCNWGLPSKNRQRALRVEQVYHNHCARSVEADAALKDKAPLARMPPLPSIATCIAVQPTVVATNFTTPLSNPLRPKFSKTRQPLAHK